MTQSSLAKPDYGVLKDVGCARLVSDCPALNTPINMTLFPDRRALKQRNEALDLVDLAERLAKTAAKSKETQPHFKMGVFGATKSNKGSYRTNENFLTVTGIEVDYDEGAMSPDEAAELLVAAGVAGAVVTSASHGLPGKGNRWRGIFPLRAAAAPAERARLVAWINGVLGGAVSLESFTAVTSYGYGHVDGRPPPMVRLIEGRFLDDCSDLEAGAIGKPSKTGLGEPQPAIDQSEDPDAVAYAGARLEAVSSRLAEAVLGDNRNGALNRAAFEMGGLVACATLEKAAVIEALVAAAHECGYCCDYGGEAEAVRVVEAGLKRGMAHPTPFEGLTGLLDDLGDVEGETPIAVYAPDQDGAIRAFTARYRDRLRFDHDRNTWFEFVGSTWWPERTDLARDLSRRECMTLANGHGKTGNGLRHVGVWEAVERGARSTRDFAVTSKDWDSNPLILGTPEGVVDLATGEVRPGRPEDKVSKRTAIHPVPLASFVPEVHCPQWLAFLDFALGGDAEAVRFLRMWSGMSLTGLTREQKLLFIHGGGGNGKGVTVNTLSWVAGDYAADVPSRTLTAKRHEEHPTELARLQGVRFAYASEVERGAKWAEQRIKSLTGGDPVTARFMRGDFFTFQPQLTLTVVGNDRPSFSAVDDAIRRRFLLLEMDRKPESPDPDLPEKLRGEGQGILAWMIEGALDWQRHGLIVPDAVRRATDEYMAEEDHFARFLAERCVNDRAARTATADLHRAYEEWQCCELAAPVLSERAVAQEMKRRGFAPAVKVRRSDGGRGNGFSGVIIGSETEEDQLLE